MKKIKSVKRLPDWLTVEKYAELQHFDANEWLEQLRYRKHLLRGNPIYPVVKANVNHEDGLSIWAARQNADITDLCNSPLVRNGPRTAFVVAGGRSPMIMTIGSFSYSGLGEAPLRSVTIGDLLDQAQVDRSPRSSSPADAGRWDYFSKDAPSRTPHDIGDQHLFLGSEQCPVLTVDITASDSDIQEFFTAWLATARKAHNLKHVRRSEPKYLKWLAYGVLPYLDVKIWSMQSGEKPTDKLLAQFVAELSGDRDVDAKRIGGVTASTAKDLMSDRSELLCELESLAVLERDVRKQ